MHTVYGVSVHHDVSIYINAALYLLHLSRGDTSGITMAKTEGSIYVFTESVFVSICGIVMLCHQ